MPSQLNPRLLCALLPLLAALLRCAPAAPLEDALTESPAGEPSGEEGEADFDLLSKSPYWKDLTELHRQEFDEEFQGAMEFHSLEFYNTSVLPARCSRSDRSMESCLHILAYGLRVYRVLLKNVEKELPGSSTLLESKHYMSLLVNAITDKMKHPQKVDVISSSTEEQLLREVDKPYTFNRRMVAHGILRQLQLYLFDGRRAVRSREQRDMLRRGRAMLYQPTAPITVGLKDHNTTEQL